VGRGGVLWLCMQSAIFLLYWLHRHYAESKKIKRPRHIPLQLKVLCLFVPLSSSSSSCLSTSTWFDDPLVHTCMLIRDFVTSLPCNGLVVTCVFRAMSSPTSTTPVPERSLNQQLVLDEDEYTEALSHIIARDFFPSLLHLGATNSYLDALHSQDPQLINASVRRLQEISSTPTTSRRPFQTPSQTPYGAGPSETPIYARQRGESGEAPPKRARFNADLGLDAFQASYTSEDNSSFTQILDDENRKRREKWAWAWEAQKRVEAQRERMLEGRERMMIEPARAAGVTERFVIEAPKPAGLITEAGEAHEGGKDGEGVEDEGKGKALAVMPELDKDDPLAPTVRLETREAGVDGWKFKVRPWYLSMVHD
jgi:protein DGCR14